MNHEREEEVAGGTAIIVDAYTYRNAGDAAIVLATSNVLRRRGISRIQIASRHLPYDRDFYQEYGLETVPAAVPFPVKGMSNDLTRGFTFFGGAILATLLALVFQLSPRLAIGASHLFGLSGFAFLALADTVVLCGGGYLYSPDSRLNLTLMHCALTRWLANVLGKQLVMMPQSIGPFRRRSDELIAKAALRAAGRVVVREEQSLAEARRLLGDKAEIVVCPDIALYGWTARGACTANRTNGSAGSIGLVAMDWTWARQAGVQDLAEYIDKLASIVNRLDDRGMSVRLMASSLVPAEGQDDQEVAISVLARAGAPALATIDRDASDVEGLRAALGRQALVVSTRLHGCLLAMVEGRPAITLAYQPKATATYELLNLSELCLDVQSFTVDELWRKVDSILSRLDEYEQKVTEAVAWARTVIEETYLNGSYTRMSMSGKPA